MKLFKKVIYTFNNNYLRYNSELSSSGRLVYTLDNCHVTITSEFGGGKSLYSIEVHWLNPHKFEYLYVHTRRGVYSVLTYFEYLQYPEQTDYIVKRYGSLQHYFDDVCCTAEYIEEKYNLRK